jgi:PAS domain S-box-containing protein
VQNGAAPLGTPDSDAEPIWRLIPDLRGTSTKVVSVLDEDGTLRYQSDLVKSLLGFDADALVGRPLEALLCDASRQQAREAVARMVNDKEKFDSWRFEFHTASGGTIWLEGMASNFLRDPRLGGILVYWRAYAG